MSSQYDSNANSSYGPSGQQSGNSKADTLGYRIYDDTEEVMTICPPSGASESEASESGAKPIIELHKNGLDFIFMKSSLSHADSLQAIKTAREMTPAEDKHIRVLDKAQALIEAQLIEDEKQARADRKAKRKRV